MRLRLRLIGLRNGEKLETLYQCTEVLFGELPPSPPAGLGENDGAGESYSDEEPELRVGEVELEGFRHDRECDVTIQSTPNERVLEKGGNVTAIMRRSQINIRAILFLFLFLFLFLVYWTYSTYFYTTIKHPQITS